MKKIPSLFQRNYETDRLVRDEVVPGSEWVLAGEGIPSIKLDGTSCMIRGGVLYKRMDRKVTKAAKKRGAPFTEADCKPAPWGWEPCEDAPNEKTGHWPGWVPVGDGPEDQWHREAWARLGADPVRGTYELLGPKVQGNPYQLDKHKLVKHGQHIIALTCDMPGRTYKEIRAWMEGCSPPAEGIVWHHPDGRMVKVKRKDFGVPWPVKSEVDA